MKYGSQLGVGLKAVACSVLVFSFAANAASRLTAISTRGPVRTGDEVLIGGVIITGTQPKTVLVLARGPSLADLGVPDVLADPSLELFSGQTMIDSNDDWNAHPRSAEIQASMAPPRDAEAAILTTLNPGAYTAIARGVSGSEGVGIVEIVEIDATGDSALGSISTRGFVSTGADVLIGGVIITGPDSQRVTFRARGPSMVDAVPSLAGLVVADPTLEIFDVNGNSIDFNDNWATHPDSDSLRADLQPTNANEAAITIVLAPGAYTAIVRGAAGTSGIGIIEAIKEGDVAAPALALPPILDLILD